MVICILSSCWGIYAHRKRYLKIILSKILSGAAVHVPITTYPKIFFFLQIVDLSIKKNVTASVKNDASLLPLLLKVAFM